MPFWFLLTFCAVLIVLDTHHFLESLWSICCPFFIDVSTIVSFVFCHPLSWCSHLFTVALSFLGSFFCLLGCDRYWVFDIYCIQIMLAICCLVDCWGRSFLSNDPAVRWHLSSAALGPLLSFSLFLVPFVSWKLRGCNRWWNYNIIYRIPVLSVIYHLVDHRGCLPLTTQRFTDSCLQPLLGCCQVISSSLFSCFLGCNE